jgi:hypothetical protein
MTSYEPRVVKEKKTRKRYLEYRKKKKEKEN